MTAEPAPIRIAAAALVGAGNKTLLVRKSGTTVFMQPGGKIDPGETPIEALLREVFEELGVTFDPETAIHLGRFDAPAAHEPGRIVEAELFRVPLDCDPEPQAEIEEVRWVGRSDAQALELAPLTASHVLPAIWGAGTF